jgi:SlyX protein
MNVHEHIEERLTQLEIKASFSEDLLDQLNAVIVRQQQDIDALVRELRRLRASLPEPGQLAPATPVHELPPHY